MLLTYLPYIAATAALIIGGLTGWWLGRKSASKKLPPQKAGGAAPHSDAIGKQQTLQNTRIELAQIEGRLKHINELKATAQQHLDEHSQEHSRLLLSLEEQRATVEEVRSNLETTKHELNTYKQKTGQLLVDIDQSQQELDMLNRMKESVEVQVNRLTQQVHRQDNRLRMLRQAIRERSKEIVEMEALVEQRSATLRRLTGDRKRLDVDIAQAKEHINQQTDRLQQLLNGQVSPASDHIHTQDHSRVDVTPPQLFSLPSQFDDSFAGVEDCEEEDLTVIPTLSDFYSRKLKAGGVKLIAQIAYADPLEIRKLLHDVPGHLNPNVEGWVQSAREILEERRNGSR